jgi:hypothetical protein
MRIRIAILTSILLLASIASCKKDSTTTPNSSSYYVKFKFNGTQKQYTAYTTSLLGTASSADGCEIIGYASGTHPAGVTISVVDNAPITTNKTYTEAIGIFTYVDESGISYVAGSVYNGTSFNLVITEIASDHIKGTFSAVLQKAGTPIEYINVTEGEFYLGRS